MLFEKFFITLKTRIAAVVLVLFLASIWLLTYLTTTRLEKDFTDVLANQQFASASYTASEVEQKIKLRFEILELVAKEISPEVMASPVKLHSTLANRPILISRFDAGVVVIDKDGAGLADFPHVAGRVGSSYTEQAYFQEVIKTGKSALGKAQIGRFTKRLAVGFAAPILDANGQISGILAAFATLDDPAFVGNIHNAKVGESGWIAVNDARHRLIVAINDPKRILQPFPKPGVNVMLDKYAAGHEGSGISINSQGRQVLSSAKQVSNTGWFVQLVLPIDEAVEPVREMTSRTYMLAAALSLVAALVVWSVIRHLFKPLSIATIDIREITTGRSELRELPVNLRDEVGELLTSFNQLFKQRQSLEEALERQAHTDHLTGLPNRRFFLDAATQEMARMARFGGTTSVLMLDIDYFKKVNDKHGHKVGDSVLQKLAATCRGTLREIDLPSRFGGEEFAFLLPGTNHTSAMEVAERLREALANTAIPLEGGLTLRFTVSIGVTSTDDPNSTIEILLNEADQALYEAKHSGRNRVCGKKQAA